jgi:[protein-PII] uridylyltransferase
VAVDELVAPLVAPLVASGSAAAIALGGYGRQELTPHGEIELLLLHTGQLQTQQVTEAVWYPLWDRQLRLEPTLKSLEQCLAESRASLAVTLRFFDARLIGGDAALFNQLVRQTTGRLRRDRPALRQHLEPLVRQRQATHPMATASATPDLVAGRGGLEDLNVVRWLELKPDGHILDALDFLLGTISHIEDMVGHASHRLTARIQDRIAKVMGLANSGELLSTLYGHARWVAFHLEGALAQPTSDRTFGLSLAVKRGRLAAERLPPLERVPSLGLRVAHLIGVAPPSSEVLEWAAQHGEPVAWDTQTQEQFWLLLRAADWRSWSFLDVTGLLTRYLPEWSRITRVPDGGAADELAIDSHCFLALRQLHEWVESSDPFARRLWHTLRHRDWVYLAVLLHEARDVATIARRAGLSEEGVATVELLTQRFGLLGEIATQRDVHDEDLLFDLAHRIGSQQQLRMLFLVAAAHSLAVGGEAWSPWRVTLLRRLFGLLEGALRSPAEVGARRRRSVEHHRELVIRELTRRGLTDLLPLVGRLPRRYLLARSAAFVARHLALAAGEPLQDREVRLRAQRHPRADTWDVLVVARDRPGLLATMAGVMALRGATVLAADASTTSDGLVLDVFTVGSAYGAPLEPSLWPSIEQDVRAALNDRLPLEALLAKTPAMAGDGGEVRVKVDNEASQMFSLVEVRAPDRVGLLYRIARALRDQGLDIHHAKVATYPDGALDVFYVWDLSGNKLEPRHACQVSEEVRRRLHG